MLPGLKSRLLASAHPFPYPPYIAKTPKVQSLTTLIATLAFALVHTAGAAEPRPLFNGKNLEGWTTWLQDSGTKDPHKVFSVENQTLRISGDGYGYIATKDSFHQYHLSLEFRWGDQSGLNRRDRKGKALDSGLFLHATGPHGNSHDGDGAYMAAIECNIFQGATGDFLLIRGDDALGNLIAPRVTVEHGPKPDNDGYPFWRAGGPKRTLEKVGRVNWIAKSPTWQDLRNFRGQRDIEHPYGEWNKLECLCQNQSITIFLNGQRINHVSQVFPSDGRILLQCEGAEVFSETLY